MVFYIWSNIFTVMTIIGIIGSDSERRHTLFVKSYTCVYLFYSILTGSKVK